MCVCVHVCLVKPQADLKTNTRASLQNDECVEAEQTRGNEGIERAMGAQAQRGPEHIICHLRECARERVCLVCFLKA